MPEMLAAFTVTAAVPVDVNVKYWLSRVPTGSLPKFRLVALSASVGVPPAPVPLSETLPVGSAAELVVMVSVPVAAPDTVGSNVA